MESNLSVTGLVTSLASHWRILVPSAATAVILWYGSYRYILDKRYRLPPGPTPVPFFGNIGSMIKLAPKYGECLHKIMRHLAKDHGDVFTFYLGHVRMICLNESSIIRETLVTQSQIFNGRLETQIPGFETLGEGVIRASDENWKRNRRLVMKAMRDFGMGKELMVSKVQDEANYLIQQFEKSSRSGEPFFPRHIIVNAVSNVICSLVFGKRFDNPEDPVFTDFIDRLDTLFRTSLETPLTLFFPFLSYFYQPRMLDSFSSVKDDVTRMIGETIKEHRKDFSPESIRDFGDLFIHAEALSDYAMPLTEYGWIMTDMFIAGTETTSTALSWTFLYLAKYPDVQQKCHDMIDSVITSDRMPESADRSQLVYLDAVFHEILRCASIVPGALYHSNLEHHAKIAGYDCPPMTLIMYNVASLHRDPIYWKDPQNFRPDRWIDENGKLANHSSHFMPFGVGPRICLGESLARTEYFIFLVAVLQRFKFELTTPDVDFDPNASGLVTTCPEYKIVANKR